MAGTVDDLRRWASCSLQFLQPDAARSLADVKVRLNRQATAAKDFATQLSILHMEVEAIAAEFEVRPPSTSLAVPGPASPEVGSPRSVPEALPPAVAPPALNGLSWHSGAFRQSEAGGATLTDGSGLMSKVVTQKISDVEMLPPETPPGLPGMVMEHQNAHQRSTKSTPHSSVLTERNLRTPTDPSPTSQPSPMAYGGSLDGTNVMNSTIFTNISSDGRNNFSKSNKSLKKSYDRSRTKVFADIEELMEKIRLSSIGDGVTHYDQFLKETGFCQALVRSHVFEIITLVVTCLNAVWLAIEIDYNSAAVLTDAHAVFQVVGNLFCVIFLTELVVRISAYRSKCRALTEPWIMFDCLLVLLFVTETWLISIIAAFYDISEGLATKNVKAFVVFRILRLFRVLRLARIIREMPELMVIVRAMQIAFRAISFVLLLTTLIVYMGAITFTVLLEDTSFGSRHFSSVSHTMGTLLIEVTLSGTRGGPLIAEASAESLFYGALLLAFSIISNILMLGVLGGLLVQTVKTVAELEKEERQVKTMVQAMDELWETWADKGVDDGNAITEAQLRNLCADQEAVKVLLNNGVDLEGLVDVSHFIFEQNGWKLSKTQFKRMVLDLRGKNAAKVKDHVETRRFMTGILKGLFRAHPPPPTQ